MKYIFKINTLKSVNAMQADLAMAKSLLLLSLVLTSLLSCSETETVPAPAVEPATTTPIANEEGPMPSANPFFEESSLFLNYPQFGLIENSHYLPAFERGIAEQLAEVEAIANQQAEANFENTIIALEVSGQLLDRVSRVFFSMAGAHTNDEIRALQQQLAPELAAHSDAILLNRRLFARIQGLYETRANLELDAESLRLLERYQLDFVRAGAGLSEEQQERMREINAEVATLQTQFSQNVLSEVNELAIVVNSREEMVGMNDALIDAASARS